MIDPVVPRHTAVLQAAKVPVTLANGPSDLELTTVAKHIKNPATGKKTLYKTSRIFIEQADAALLSDEEEVRGLHRLCQVAVLFAARAPLLSRPTQCC